MWCLRSASTLLPEPCPLHGLKLINSISTPFYLPMSGRERGKKSGFTIRYQPWLSQGAYGKSCQNDVADTWPLHPTSVLDSIQPCRPRHDYISSVISQKAFPCPLSLHRQSRKRQPRCPWRTLPLPGTHPFCMGQWKS